MIMNVHDKILLFLSAILCDHCRKEILVAASQKDKVKAISQQGLLLTPKMVQQVFQAFESIGGVYLSHPYNMAQTILKVIKFTEPSFQKSVVKDAESIFKMSRIV